MNYLNLFILFLIVLYILQGFHKGFLVSVGNTIGMVLSWIISFLFSPMLATSIQEGTFYKFLLNFTEGAERLVDKPMGNHLVGELSTYQISDIVTRSSDYLPAPFDTLIENNMQELVFQGQGPLTVAEYFNYTVANAVVNILAFLLVYALTRVIIALVLNTVNYASPLPVLKYCDGLAGAGVSVVRGIFDLFALGMIIPVVMMCLPADFTMFSDMLAGSSAATFFYENNFLLEYISGVIAPF